MERFVAIGKAAALGVSITTLRRWEAAGQLAAEHTPGRHRRYDLAKLCPEMFHAEEKAGRKTVAYARVPGHDQQDDLERQKQVLERYCATQGWTFELVAMAVSLDGVTAPMQDGQRHAHPRSHFRSMDIWHTCELNKLVLRTATKLPIVSLDIMRLAALKRVTDLRQSVLGTEEWLGGLLGRSIRAKKTCSPPSASDCICTAI